MSFILKLATSSLLISQALAIDCYISENYAQGSVSPACIRYVINGVRTWAPADDDLYKALQANPSAVIESYCKTPLCNGLQITDATRILDGATGAIVAESGPLAPNRVAPKATPTPTPTPTPAIVPVTVAPIVAPNSPNPAPAPSKTPAPNPDLKSAASNKLALGLPALLAWLFLI